MTRSPAQRLASTALRLAVVVLAIWLAAGPALSQSSPYMGGTTAELEALRSLEEYKLVRLREQAREILKENPSSFAGHYLLGFSLHNSEGDLPRSKFHLERCIELFRTEHGSSPELHVAWGWYERALIELIQVNAEMDLYEEQLQSLDDYVALSRHLTGADPPNVIAAYAWPLMKLEREHEAREKLASVAHYEDQFTRTTYLNTLGALEMEFGNPEASYAAFKQLTEEVRARGWPQSATFLRNLGEASAGIGRFDEAERLYSEATRYFESFTYSNPWFDLAFLYLAQARFSEAVDAVKKTHTWRFAVQPFLAQQSWAQDQHVTAELLYHLGETEKALALAESIARRPDRQGGDSIQLDQKEAGTLLLYRTLLLTEAQRLREQATWSSFWDRLKLRVKRSELQTKARIAGLQIKAMATKNDRLVASLRPYYAPGTIVISDWHRPDLVTVYGPGVTAEALATLEADPPRTMENEKPVLDVIRAEIEWAVGDRKETIELLTATIPDLGESRAVVRARAEARLAAALFRQGRTSEGLEIAARVFDTAPSMFRHLDIRLPIRFESDGSPLSEETVRLLRKSPRFRASSEGFPITVRQAGSNLIATLLTPAQSLLAEVSVPVQTPAPAEASEGQAEASPATPPVRLSALFHQKAFAPRIDLSQRDINSLDGSTLTESRRTERAREAIGQPPGNGQSRL